MTAIAPRRLIQALLLRILHCTVSFIAHLSYNMLYRWFIGLSLNDSGWGAATLTKNRRRFIDSLYIDCLLDTVVDPTISRQR
ncbi:hypothetical protein SAOR_00410 [Salinisphaera orenii MK-B5]|uniref:Transposase InsH N-terminal domain-containing protein n=1 Tax=Salinisphaera orenii MK-B5 TaxID=856730 RepID=A0A423PYH4_9GAMM|nr:transposase [Salinisphaera orenii]ROO30573.1 hypothetical protein SAOR_00410 [Salinisphaera orenii MK-B5]